MDAHSDDIGVLLATPYFSIKMLASLSKRSNEHAGKPEKPLTVVVSYTSISLQIRLSEHSSRKVKFSTRLVDSDRSDASLIADAIVQGKLRILLGERDHLVLKLDDAINAVFDFPHLSEKAKVLGAEYGKTNAEERLRLLRTS